jgi:hypothetical protein
MRNLAHSADLCEERGASFGTMVSDLIALIEHVQASIDLIEAEIAWETSDGGQEASNVVVLDDVTPQYLKASRALNHGSASLGTALRFLLDAGQSGRQSIRPTAR